MTHAIAKICAAINADDAVVRLDADEMREVIDALDERERSIGRERTRADAAEAERDAARREAALSAMERDTLRSLTDAMRADNERLRAIVEGRTVAPTIREARAHCHGAASESRGAFVVTRLDWGAHGGARVATGLQPLPGAPHRWIAIDATGRPCPWPVTP